MLAANSFPRLKASHPYFSNVVLTETPLTRQKTIMGIFGATLTSIKVNSDLKINWNLQPGHFKFSLPKNDETNNLLSNFTNHSISFLTDKNKRHMLAEDQNNTKLLKTDSQTINQPNPYAICILIQNFTLSLNIFVKWFKSFGGRMYENSYHCGKVYEIIHTAATFIPEISNIFTNLIAIQDTSRIESNMVQKYLVAGAHLWNKSQGLQASTNATSIIDKNENPYADDDSFCEGLMQICIDCKARLVNIKILKEQYLILYDNDYLLRSMECPLCKNLNSLNSLKNLKEFEDIFTSFIVIKVAPQRYQLKLNLLIPGAEVLYHPDKSNAKAARNASIRVMKNLIKIGQFDNFQKEIDKTINDQHATFLDLSQESEILKKFHCFNSINFASKSTSRSQKLRPVLNARLE